MKTVRRIVPILAVLLCTAPAARAEDAGCEIAGFRLFVQAPPLDEDTIRRELDSVPDDRTFFDATRNLPVVVRERLAQRDLDGSEALVWIEDDEKEVLGWCFADGDTRYRCNRVPNLQRFLISPHERIVSVEFLEGRLSVPKWSHAFWRQELESAAHGRRVFFEAIVDVRGPGSAGLEVKGHELLPVKQIHDRLASEAPPDRPTFESVLQESDDIRWGPISVNLGSFFKLFAGKKSEYRTRLPPRAMIKVDHDGSTRYVFAGRLSTMSKLSLELDKSVTSDLQLDLWRYWRAAVL